MSRGDEMIARMTTACDRCGLRGPHRCIEQVDPFSRPGLGPVMPPAPHATADQPFRHRDGLETATAAAVRLGVDKHRLGDALARAGMKREGGYWKLPPKTYDRIVEQAGRARLAAKAQRTGRVA